MFRDIKAIMDTPTVRRIISYAAFDGSPAGTASTVEKYKESNQLRFFGWLEDEQVLGICGFEEHPDKVEVHLLSVDEIARGRGIGRAMVSRLLEKYQKPIEAETDDDAVGFYRKCSFAAASFEHPQHGKRWRCKVGSDAKTGWERHRRTHFDEIVENYDRVRWDYPAELFDDIFAYSGTGYGKRAIEIGAGTGKATLPILNAGYAVTAVEMGANMVDFLSEKFKEYKNFSVINDTFEGAVLDDINYDLIYAASAFHWVDAEIGCPKVFRLLKSGGTFALFRNNAVQADGNELYDNIQTVYDKYYYSYYKPDKRPIPISEMSYEDFLKPDEIYRGFRFKSLEQYGFKDITMKLYEATRIYNADDYIALLDTMSDHLALPDDKRVALFAGIREAILKHGGHLQMNYVFQLYMGRKL